MSQHAGHRILVIDDQAAIHEDYRKVLSKQTAGSTAALDRAAAELFGDDPAAIVTWEGFDIDFAFQGQEGLDLVEQAVADRRPYALAFVDIRMPPGWDGVETVRRIWEVDPEILIVICSAYSDYSWQEMVRELGRNDRYLILRKPFDNIEVRQFAMALTERWSQSRTDILTELLNRRALGSYLDLEWKRSSERRLPLACAMLDLDHFKRVNDSLGHQAGDEVLRQVAQTLSSKCRATDSIYRYGGEEICVLLPNTGEAEAVAWAEQARRAIEATPIVLANRSLHMTVSIGVAERAADDDGPKRLIDRADQALILAKAAGRNRVFGPPAAARPARPGDPWTSVPVSEVMSTAFFAVRSSASLADALRLLSRSPLDELPVVSAEGTLLGVLPAHALLQLMIAPGRLRESVQTCMRREFAVCTAEAPVSTVVDELERPEVHRLFVLRDGQPVGVVSREGVLRYWSQRGGSRQAVVPAATCLVGSLDRQRLAESARGLAKLADQLLGDAQRPASDLTSVSLTQLAALQGLVDGAWDLLARDDPPPAPGQGPDFSGFGTPDAPLAPLG